VTAPAAFAAFAAALAAVLLVLTRASSRALDGAVIVGVDDPPAEAESGLESGPGPRPAESGPGPEARPGSEPEPELEASPAVADPRPPAVSTPDSDPEPGPRPDRPRLTTRGLLRNVTASQALFLALLAAGAWLAGVPRSMLGLAPGGFAARPLLTGLAAGVGLAVANAAVGRVADRVGAATPERLRAALMPGSAAGWVVLMTVVLPAIAVFEELLFRAALIGVPAAGLGLPPWPLAVASSLAFGLGHVAQGRLGVAVAAGLGLALAALFLATGSLAAVVIAHYVVNAAEFLAHGRPGADG